MAFFKRGRKRIAGAQSASSMPYAIQVGIVFSSKPRVAGATDSIWVARDREQSKFRDYFMAEGVHVLVDGPTGTGKTSLALTALTRLKVPYVMVPLTDGLTWPQFCSQVLFVPIPKRADAELTTGIQGLKPVLSLRVTRGQPSVDPRDPVGRLEWANSVGEHDICDLLVRENVTLMIDDAESASSELLVRLANLAKLLTTDSGQARNAKLIIVGTGDVCRRLYLAKPSLENRIGEVSLGTFPNPGESWDFLRRGFDHLGKRHPASSDVFSEREQLKKVVRATFDAADGLPKALNEMGRDICLFAQHRDISAATVLKTAKDRALANWKHHKRAYGALMQGLKHNPVAANIVSHLHHHGIGLIHDSDQIHGDMDAQYGEDQIDQALNDLTRLQFITRTGISNQVVFVNSPSLAHTLGVVIRDIDGYPGARQLFGLNKDQLPLLLDAGALET